MGLGSAAMDVISCWFHLGLHDVLERIFLPLSPRSVRSCRQVSPTWRAIVAHYHCSTIPRIVKLKESRLEMEWKLRKPIVSALNMSVSPKRVLAFAVGRGYVAVAAQMRTHQEQRSLDILLFRQGKLRRTIKMGSRYGDSEWMQLVIGDRFLAASLCPASDVSSTGYFVFMWNSYYHNSFNVRVLAPLQSVSPVTQLPLVAPRLFFMPTLLRGLLHVPILRLDTPGFKGLAFETWNVQSRSCLPAVGTKNSLSCLTASSPFEVVEFLWNRHSSEKYFVIEASPLYGIVSLMSLCDLASSQQQQQHQHQQPQQQRRCWSVSKRDCSPCLVGLDREYVVLAWTMTSTGSLMPVEVYSVADGQLRQALDVHYELVSVKDAQICCGRLAILGAVESGRLEVVIYSLGSGERLLSCKKDLLYLDDLPPGWQDTDFQDFCLEKNRVWLIWRAGVWCAKFDA